MASPTQPVELPDLLGVFDQAPSFLCFLRGPELRFELANKAYLKLIGHRDLIGKPIREALPEIEGQGYFELLDRVFATGEPFVGTGMAVLIQQHPGAELSEAYVDLIYQPIRDAGGAVIGILAQGHDVTEVKRAEAEREEAEEARRVSDQRYRTLFASIDDGFCIMQMIVDDKGKTYDYRFLETNAAFERQTGLVDAVGKTALELVPNLDESWFRLYGGVAETGESARFENHAPAMHRWFEAYANRVGPPEQRLVALVFKDITARKKVEEEREALLARESAAREAAEQADRVKDEFIATVSHELRTPLNSMLGWVQMLRSGALSSEKYDRALETIERNARSQTQLIEDLLDIGRILAGKLRLEVEALDVRSCVEAALETVRPAAEAKDIELQAALSSGATVMGDPHRLQQVVWNLLSNAVKFTPKGGRVQVVIEVKDSAVSITVADTGRGISADFLPHVFERFRQGDGAATRAHGGLGLGLSIVKQLVELHGGSVKVASVGVDQGAAFTVVLPIAVTRRRDVSTPTPFISTLLRQAAPELAGLEVLLVDDEDDTREMLCTMLETSGAKVRTASRAAEALAMFTEKAPELLLSDIGMPDEDGYSLIQKIRQLPSEMGGEIPAVALTAYARTEDRTRALLSGFNSHVPKPVEPVELVAVIAALSGRTRKRLTPPT